MNAASTPGTGENSHAIHRSTEGAEEDLGADFFVDGGTLSLKAPSYVKRPTDDELLERLLHGEFCYVLTPRQMGKSSLMYRTADRLEKAGVRTVKIDLNAIGSVALDVDQWYLGLLNQMRRTLKLAVDEVAWWEDRKAFSNVVRFLDFLEEVVLGQIENRVVIFIDEIDYTLKLDFRDDFFAAVRAIYNHRSDRPAFQRMTFTMLGVAAPTDLIKDKAITPFNIGHGIALQEFSLEDAEVLRHGLETLHPLQGERIFCRIFDWTGGHPYLTQRLCKAVAEETQKDWNDTEVDLLVESLFFKEEARKTDKNLQFVQDRILSSPQRGQLLSMYRKVVSGRTVHDDGQSIIQNQLKLSGLVEVENGRLQVRNRIYRRAFGRAWVRKNTPTRWPTVAAVASALLAVAAVAVLLFDGVFIPAQAQNQIRDFPRPDRPGERLAALGSVIRMQGIILPADFDSLAIEQFFGMPRAEQLNLFSAEDCQQANQADAEYFILELSKTLADVDESGETTPLLQAMSAYLDCLKNQSNLRKPEMVADLDVMLDNWLRGRNLAPNPSSLEDPYRLASAERLYRQALAANEKLSQPEQINLSLLYEHARLLARIYARNLELGEPSDAQLYETALDELERIWAIAVSSPLPAVTPSPSPLPVKPTSRETGILATQVSLTSDQPETTSSSPTNNPRPTSKPTEDKSKPTRTIPPSPTAALASAATATPEIISSKFRNRVDWQINVRRLLADNYELWLALAQAPATRYPTLNRAGLYLAPTATPTVTITPTARTTATPLTAAPILNIPITFIGQVVSALDGQGMEGIEVSVYGAFSTYPDEGTLLGSILTDASGSYEFTVEGAPDIEFPYSYLHLLVTEPPSYQLSAVNSSLGTVYEDRWIEHKFSRDTKVYGPDEFFLEPVVPSQGTPISSSFATATASGFSIELNTDRPGLDIAVVDVIDAIDCLDLCAKEGKCQAFSFVEKSGQCFLKDSISTPVANDCCTSGARISQSLLFPVRLSWPADSPLITQYFGENPEIYKIFGYAGHEGIDISAQTGDPVYAAADGVVTMAEQPESHPYGLQVRIQHLVDGLEFETIYAHLSETLVQVGDTVKAGEQIGRVGNTGDSSGPNLHFVLRITGASTPGYPEGIVDPLPYLELESLKQPANQTQPGPTPTTINNIFDLPPPFIILP